MGIVPVFTASAATSCAISRYGDYLKGVYSRSSVSSDGKFPPTPSKTYVNLVVVKYADQIRDLEDIRSSMLHGRVDEMIKGKTKVELADILQPQKNGSPVSLVFVQGPPGIGKSTLAWELCRRWDRKQYDLAVLLRLREREVQQIGSIADLFPHVDQDLRKSVAKHVLCRDGKRLLFILDGYDELPFDLRHEGLLFKLLKGEVFSKCSVLVTSRPSATEDLYMVCRPQIQRHVEILGFTQDCVKDYASSIFTSEPELDDFLQYVSASESPAINSLMYIPLNAAIIVNIYRDNRSRDCPLPKTLTQVYYQLCLTLLKRSLRSTDPPSRCNFNSFSDLPSNFHDDFKKLAQLAFDQFERHQVVFYSCDDLVHFGFLDSVPALYGGGEVSYNFLHLTLQEFLAAYHIAQLSNGIDVFKHHSEDRRWEVVWRFVSGLTRFQYFMNIVKYNAFASPFGTGEYLIKNLLLHCLFEGQVMFNYMAVLGTSKLCQGDLLHCTSPLDRYALGYCIANCSSATSWKVHIREGSGESFMWGLNSNDRGKGVISYLEMRSVLPTCLDSFPPTILSDIVNLKITVESGADVLVEVLPLMKSLSTLYLGGRDSLDLQIGPKLIHAISKTKVTALDLLFEFFLDQMFLSSLHKLITNRLKDLSFELSDIDSISTKPLCDVLFGLSSLNRLTLGLPYFTENSFDLLETNTSLITVVIAFFDSCTLQLKSLSKILERNTTIEKLEWTCLSELADLDFFVEHVEDLNLALSLNTTLKKLILHMETPRKYQQMRNSSLSLIHDTRVKYELLDDVFDELASPPSFLTSVSPSMF